MDEIWNGHFLSNGNTWFSIIQIHRIFLHINDQTRETTPVTNVHSCHRPVEALNILIIIAILLKRAPVMVWFLVGSLTYNVMAIMHSVFSYRILCPLFIHHRVYSILPGAMYLSPIKNATTVTCNELQHPLSAAWLPHLITPDWLCVFGSHHPRRPTKGTECMGKGWSWGNMGHLPWKRDKSIQFYRFIYASPCNTKGHFGWGICGGYIN